MRLHVLGLPHTQTVAEAMTVCAFTQKIVKFGEMMSRLGYEIVLYSGEHNETECAEHVTVFSDAQQREWYGDHDPNLLPTIATWDASDRPWVEMNAAVTRELIPRLEPGDLILLIGGYAQKPVADAARAVFPAALSVEWAAGYEGWFSDQVCFESYAWRHHCYGSRSLHEGRWFDTVIPNYFRPDDFSVPTDKDGSYVLFTGRVTARKGPHVAAQIAAEAGVPLKIAGSGVTDVQPGRIVGQGIVIEGDHVEYVGVVGVEERNRLMGGARALLAPTTYIEPFGAVAVEAQLCGTPAITTDWGAFTETVTDGVTGFRFRTLAEGAEAIDRAAGLDPTLIRAHALSRYSLDAVGPMYDRWFRELSSLWGEGWYAKRNGRSMLVR